MDESDGWAASQIEIRPEREADHSRVFEVERATSETEVNDLFRAAARSPELDGILGYEDRPPTPAEMEEMKARVRSAMEQGAFGLSSGLFYLPGNYAETDEVVELAIVADVGAFRGGAYSAGGADVVMAERARHGARLGELVASLSQATEALFAYAEDLQLAAGGAR